MSVTQSMWALDMSLCRRNGKEGLSGMAIADITLLSGFSALRADLEKVQSAAQAGRAGAVGRMGLLVPQELGSIPEAIPAAEPCLV